uniref:Condensation domain-containing protein n=1 Tax=Grammatophora oceanica TaxID=210454 RepID=A0A7S1VF20_9STRA|mmetsp:Transcript_44877/g.66609  ORF Transcript_44877/g.66609 Transcript_44877/m.66609 type:complete len:282 (+) Transcript_44877:600-1445(+)
MALHIMCDHTISDVTSLVILSKFVIKGYYGETVSGEKRRFSDFGEWQARLGSAPDSERFYKSQPVYGIPKRGLLSLLPCSIRARESFEPVPFGRTPKGISPRIAFLTLWHSMLIEHGGSTEMIVGEVFDVRKTAWAPSGLERTLGCLFHTQEWQVRYSPTMDLEANMQRLQDDLMLQEGKKSLWSKAHGPPVGVVSEGWVFNFIDIRIAQDGLPASIQIFTPRPVTSSIIQREPSILVFVFFDGASVIMHIEYCCLNLSRTKARSMGSALVGKLLGSGFGS